MLEVEQSRRVEGELRAQVQQYGEQLQRVSSVISQSRQQITEFDKYRKQSEKLTAVLRADNDAFKSRCLKAEAALLEMSHEVGPQ